MVKISAKRITIVLGMTLISGALLWLSYSWSERYYYGKTAQSGRNALNLHVENIRGRLGRFIALPSIYARDADVQALLVNPDDRELLARVNTHLEDWTFSTGAADTYLLDRGGTTIAASNWADLRTFVGENYAYRPYYQHALLGRLGRFFALGTQSSKRGYYFSFPVRRANYVLGVMVVKVGVDQIERELRASPHSVFITGPNGIILLAGHPELRLKTVSPLSKEALAEIRQNRQFDVESLSSAEIYPLPASAGPNGMERVRAIPDRSYAKPATFLHLRQSMLSEEWTAHLLIETRYARNQTLATTMFVATLLLAVALAAILIWQHRRQLVGRLHEREHAQAVLEQTVTERTADLSAANRMLEDEIGERRAAEVELRQAQNDLVQAAKLAGLGQMSAALSHEFNQPLTAIRTYAVNAQTFVERGRNADASDNLGRIAKLTERMADLSRHLSSFARKPQATIRPVSLSSALQETLELLAGRLGKAGVSLDVSGNAQGMWVKGGHVRLQQVIMNLVTNAVAKTERPSIAITVDRDERWTTLTVEDNGPGLPPEIADQVFDPFFTTKDVGQGLGLGLSISFNIIKDFGGEIRIEDNPDGGARFVVTFLSVDEPDVAAAE